MKSPKAKKVLSSKQREELLGVLQVRFHKNPQRHAGIDWAKVAARLEVNPEKLWSLAEMERTGGEPDVIGHDKKSGEFLFIDCAAQSPDARASLCYDREALDGRKKFPPRGCVTEAAAAMGVELLDEAQYFEVSERGHGLNLDRGTLPQAKAALSSKHLTDFLDGGATIEGFIDDDFPSANRAQVIAFLEKP